MYQNNVVHVKWWQNLIVNETNNSWVVHGYLTLLSLAKLYCLTRAWSRYLTYYFETDTMDLRMYRECLACVLQTILIPPRVTAHFASARTIKPSCDLYCTYNCTVFAWIYCILRGFLAFWNFEINLSYIILVYLQSEMKRLGIFKKRCVIGLLMIGHVLGVLYLLNASTCKYNCLLFNCRPSNYICINYKNFCKTW